MTRIKNGANQRATKGRIGRVIGIIVLIGIVAAVLYGAWVAYSLNRSYPALPDTLAGSTSEAQLARGKYVLQAADCAACHTAASGQPFAGGYKLGTPFGTIASSNITSDKETGIGNWTAAQFDRAVRHGQGSHGYLYPAMPYTAYARMSSQDIADLWAYVKTIPPVHNKVVEDQLPFPYNQRWLLGGWNMLFFRDHTFVADASKDAEYNRGAYLVDGAGHCMACHTAKNPLGGDVSAYGQGGALDGWYAPDLTPNPHVGLGRWSIADITSYLHSGSNGKAMSAGPMTEAVENSTQYLTEPDLHAIAVYLKGLPASPSTAPQPVPATEASMPLGQRVYMSQCIACHVSNGQGVSNMIPALANSAVINSPNASTVLHMILKGSSGPQTAGNPTGAGMPRFDWKLSDEQIAAVATYIRNSWGNAATSVDTATVTKARTALNAASWSGKPAVVLQK